MELNSVDPVAASHTGELASVASGPDQLVFDGLDHEGMYEVERLARSKAVIELRGTAPGDRRPADVRDLSTSSRDFNNLAFEQPEALRPPELGARVVEQLKSETNSENGLLPRGCGAVFSFDLKGSRAQGQAFIEALKIFSHLANVGDCRSLVIHPASTTHFRMDDAALQAAGITAGTIRLSIGLEDADDLIDDLKRAFKVAEKAR